MTEPDSDPSNTGHLTKEQVLRLIEIVEEFDPIVVGGQAVNLWVEYYQVRKPGFIEGDKAFTSKDLDFFSNRKAAEKLADALGGEVLIPGMDDATPNAALVIGTLDGRRIEVDFMASILGVEGRRISNNHVMIVASVPSRQHVIRVLLLHPLDCLRSRLANINILGRLDEHSIRQAQAAIDVLRAFIDDMLDSPERRKHIQTILLDLSYVIRDDHRGKNSHLIHDLRPNTLINDFSEDPRLDERWRTLTLEPCKLRVERWLGVGMTTPKATPGPKFP